MLSKINLLRNELIMLRKDDIFTWLGNYFERLPDPVPDIPLVLSAHFPISMIKNKHEKTIKNIISG